jgi:hypothetical protein
VTPPSVRAELAAAIRAVNARYNALPESRRPDIHWEGVDAEVDAAILSGDRERAMRAIEAWKRHHLALCEEAAK